MYLAVLVILGSLYIFYKVRQYIALSCGKVVLEDIDRAQTYKLKAQGFVRVGIVSVTIIYAPFLELMLGIFDCVDTPGGMKMREDITTSCDDSTYKAVAIVCGFLCVLYGMCASMRLVFSLRFCVCAARHREKW